jgi:LysM repeat protein
MVRVLFMFADDFRRRPERAEPNDNRSRPRFWRHRLSLVLSLVSVTALALAALSTGSLSRPNGGKAVAAPQRIDVALQRFPVDGACWYTDTWHATRSGGRLHEGVDIGASGGTPLLAVADGKIAKVYTERPDWKGGNAIRLTAADGTYFFYGHLQSFAAGIELGVPVTAGQVIGYVGKTGNAGVDHLHFEAHPGGGAAVNPYPLVKAVNTCANSGRAQTVESPSTTAPKPTGTPTPPRAIAGQPQFVPPQVGSPACVGTHLVANGDYWYLIAARYSVSVRAVTAANGRTVESWIYPNEVLCVPAADWKPTTPVASAAPAPAPAAPGGPTTVSAGTPTTVATERPQPLPKDKCQEFYTVRKGDYWVMLGEWYKKRASRIAAANGKLLTDPIYPDDKICIPY